MIYIIELIIFIIYGLSILLMYWSVIEVSKYSETSKFLGKETYLTNGFFVSFIPIINTINGFGWLIYRLKSGTAKQKYKK